MAEEAFTVVERGSLVAGTVALCMGYDAKLVQLFLSTGVACNVASGHYIWGACVYYLVSAGYFQKYPMTCLALCGGSLVSSSRQTMQLLESMKELAKVIRARKMEI